MLRAQPVLNDRICYQFITTPLASPDFSSKLLQVIQDDSESMVGDYKSSSLACFEKAAKKICLAIGIEFPVTHDKNELWIRCAQAFSIATALLVQLDKKLLEGEDPVSYCFLRATACLYEGRGYSFWAECGNWKKYGSEYKKLTLEKLSQLWKKHRSRDVTHAFTQLIHSIFLKESKEESMPELEDEDKCEWASGREIFSLKLKPKIIDLSEQNESNAQTILNELKAVIKIIERKKQSLQRSLAARLMMFLSVSMIEYFFNKGKNIGALFFLLMYEVRDYQQLNKSWIASFNQEDRAKVDKVLTEIKGCFWLGNTTIDAAITACKQYQNRIQVILDNYKDQRVAFLSGFHPRLGRDSAVLRSFSKSTLFHEIVVEEIFQFAGKSLPSSSNIVIPAKAGIHLKNP